MVLIRFKVETVMMFCLEIRAMIIFTVMMAMILMYGIMVMVMIIYTSHQVTIK